MVRSWLVHRNRTASQINSDEFVRLLHSWRSRKTTLILSYLLGVLIVGVVTGGFKTLPSKEWTLGLLITYYLYGRMFAWYWRNRCYGKSLVRDFNSDIRVLAGRLEADPELDQVFRATEASPVLKQIVIDDLVAIAITVAEAEGELKYTRADKIKSRIFFPTFKAYQAFGLFDGEFNQIFAAAQQQVDSAKELQLEAELVHLHLPPQSQVVCHNTAWDF